MQGHLVKLYYYSPYLWYLVYIGFFKNAYYFVTKQKVGRLFFIVLCPKQSAKGMITNMTVFSCYHRKSTYDKLQKKTLDVLVIGGGITGAGIALDSVTRG